MNRYFRFCQPIGCALITLALLDTVCNSFWLFLQYTSLEHKYFEGESASEDFCRNILWNFLIALRFLLCFILWSGILMGKNVLLTFWVSLSFLTDAGTIGFVLLDKLLWTGYQSPSVLNVWGLTSLEDPVPIFLSLGAFLCFRVYLWSVGLQGVVCLYRKYDTAPREDISDIQVCLEPIGGGAGEICEFLKDFPGMGAVIMLTTELVWNLEHLGLREMFVFMLERSGKSLLAVEPEVGVVDYIFLEDNILRGIRIFIAFAGLVFIHKERLNFVRLWILVYLISLVCSNVIFALTVTVKGLDWIVFHGFCHIFDNLARLFVLYYSFKFAIVHRRTILKL